MNKFETARLAHTPKDYERFKLGREQVAPWEDGMRTNGDKGSYEWWYTDARLRDRSILAVVFHTKPTRDIDEPLNPYVSVIFDRPSGDHLESIWRRGSV